MFSSTIILGATVLVEGTRFHWWLTDGVRQWLSVSHPSLGTVTQPLNRGPEPQARDMARELLRGNRPPERKNAA
jgi:hypothetical protein